MCLLSLNVTDVVVVGQPMGINSVVQVPASQIAEPIVVNSSGETVVKSVIYPEGESSMSPSGVREFLCSDSLSAIADQCCDLILLTVTKEGNNPVSYEGLFYAGSVEQSIEPHGAGSRLMYRTPLDQGQPREFYVNETTFQIQSAITGCQGNSVIASSNVAISPAVQPQSAIQIGNIPHENILEVYYREDQDGDLMPSLDLIDNSFVLTAQTASNPASNGEPGNPLVNYGQAFSPSPDYAWYDFSGGGLSYAPTSVTFYDDYASSLNFAAEIKVYGSNDGSNWTLIETITHTYSPAGASYALSNTTSYSFFRFAISELNNLSQTYWVLEQIQLFSAVAWTDWGGNLPTEIAYQDDGLNTTIINNGELPIQLKFKYL